MNEKLKPCPFCGGEQINVNKSIYFPKWEFGCPVCFAIASFVRANTFDEAAEAWNRRDGEGKIVIRRCNMRLIDADALCKELDQMYSDGKSHIDIHCRRNERDVFYADAVKDAIRKVNSAPAIMQWVSVDTDLPEYELKVLVLTERNTMPYSYGFAEHKGNGRWNLLYGAYGKVTHWMPVPPPPEK